MQPGAALVCDNWKPTMRGVSLRGGCEEWCQLPETTPVISAFEYNSGVTHQIFAANQTKIYNVTTSTPIEVDATRTSGNHVASQLANQGGDFMIVADDAGDPLLRYDGTDWTSLDHDDACGFGRTARRMSLMTGCAIRRRFALEMPGGAQRRRRPAPSRPTASPTRALGLRHGLR